MQIPHGPEHLNCPFWQKPMSECCHACPLWSQIRGVDAQTGRDIEDEWNCSIPSLLRALIANVQQTAQAGASADKVATAVDDNGRQVAKEIALLHNSVKDSNIINTTILNALPLLDEVAKIQSGRGLLIEARDEPS